MSGGLGYVVAAYGVFGGILGAYVGILVPRARAKRRTLAEIETRLADREA